MTPDRLHEFLDLLNWRTGDLAAMAHVSPVTARRGQSGKRPIPAQVVAAIEAMASAAVQLAAKGNLIQEPDDFVMATQRLRVHKALHEEDD
jgi:hypothetical protein